MKAKLIWALLPVCLLLAGCEQSTSTTTTTTRDGTNVNVTIATNRVEVTVPPVVVTNVPPAPR